MRPNSNLIPSMVGVFLLLAGVASSADQNWQAFPNTFESNAMINAMVLHRDMLYVGGAFNSIGGVQANNVARWDGTNWSALGNFSGGVQTLAVTDEGLFVGGQFTSISGVPATNVARWDGTNW